MISTLTTMESVVSPALKVCTKCGQAKSVSLFGPLRKNPDGLHYHCRACKLAAEAARRTADPEKINAANRENRAADLDRWKAKEARANAKRSADAAYRAECRRKETARLVEAHRLRAQVHTCPICGVEFCPTFGRQSMVKTCSDDCRKVQDTRRNWRKGSRYRALKRAARIEYVDPFTVFERDGWKCHICREPTPRELRGTYHDRAPEVDHVRPLSLDGEHSYANTACACRACNIAKGARL